MTCSTTEKFHLTPASSRPVLVQERHPATEEADALSGFGDWHSTKVFTQVHGCFVVRGWAPVGQTVAVGVVSPGEFSPAAGHHGFNLVVRLIPADCRVV